MRQDNKSNQRLYKNASAHTETQTLTQMYNITTSRAHSGPPSRPAYTLHGGTSEPPAKVSSCGPHTRTHTNGTVPDLLSRVGARPTPQKERQRSDTEAAYGYHSSHHRLSDEATLLKSTTACLRSSHKAKGLRTATRAKRMQKKCRNPTQCKNETNAPLTNKIQGVVAALQIRRVKGLPR